MGSERRNVLLIVAVALAARLSAAEFLGLNTFSLKEVLPFVATALFLLSAYILHQLGDAKRHVRSHVQPVILAIESTTVYALIYFLSRLLLEFSTPPSGSGLLFVAVLGLQSGLLVAFFYVLYQASVVASSSTMKSVRRAHDAPTLFKFIKKEKDYFAYVVISSAVAIYVLSQISQLSPLIYNTAILVVIGVIFLIYLKSNESYTYCRRILGKAECRTLDKLHMANTLLLLYVLANASQELLFARVGGSGSFVLMSGVSQLAALLLVFLSTHLILVRFMHAATVVEVGEKGYQASLA